MALKRNISLLGATGSVGRAVLSVVRAHPRHFHIRALAANRNVAEMEKLCAEFRPSLAAMSHPESAALLEKALKKSAPETKVAGGADGVNAAAELDECCTVAAAIAGAQGLEPLLAAARSGKRILLANKEALILAGELLNAEARAGGALLLPVDSEHCALFELLHTRPDAELKTRSRLWLTASGGALRDFPLEKLASATPAETLKHPTWQMGAKITVDCATMMNKGLEVMEAAVLFRRKAEDIGVVVHPQSVAHALVEFGDGAMAASLSAPDMRIPVARMLAWPGRAALPDLARPSWAELSAMTFAEPDPRRYPCLGLAYEALAAGGATPAALSAANEIAVARFLRGESAFGDIARLNEKALARAATAGFAQAKTLDDCLAADADARRFAEAA